MDTGNTPALPRSPHFVACFPRSLLSGGRQVVVLLALGLSLVACGSDSGNTTQNEDTGFTALYKGYFQGCTGCHTPGGPGRTAQTEQTLDFSSRDTAYTTLRSGTAAGLVGNQEACNGTPFVGQTYEQSLLAATLDARVRQAIDLAGHPGCDMDAISDMTVKVGQAPSSAFLADLKQWIDSGTPNE